MVSQQEYLKRNEWMAKVDFEIERRTGTTHEDLIDYCYADAYDDGLTPAQAARAAIRSQEE